MPHVCRCAIPFSFLSKGVHDIFEEFRHLVFLKLHRFFIKFILKYEILFLPRSMGISDRFQMKFGGLHPAVLQEP